MFAGKNLRSIVCGLVLAGASQVAAAQAGYSPADNDFIWQSRLDADRQAQKAAYAKCHWKPERPSYFNDDPAAANEPHQDQPLYAGLMRLLRADQNARAASDAWPNAFTWQKLAQVDAASLVEIKPIIGDGFPTERMVGYGGVNAMLVLVAHADADLAFQQRAYARLREAAKNGEVPPIFPVILATIRPKIVGKADTGNDRTGQAHAAAAAAVVKPKDCYSAEYASSFNGHLKQALLAHFSAEAGFRKP